MCVTQIYKKYMAMKNERNQIQDVRRQHRIFQ